ncbi:MAG: tyrosine-type recombinase/integrase [Alphaproteobacteria bacterium]|nr:tyrosine-type recombinase/integrase [Alphaproteobacteria bacterium]
MSLTVLEIEHLKPRAKIYRVAGSEGLCLEIAPTGSKLWRLRYTFNGKPQMMSLGKFPKVSLEQARKKRDETKALVEAGKHPARERKAEKLRRMVEGQNTFEKIARHMLELRAGRLNAKYHTQCLSRLEALVFPMIGALPITEITIPDVARVVEKIGERGTIETAKRMKQLISQTFRYAAQRGQCQFNPAADMRDLLPAAEQKHHSCIHPRELPQLLLDMRECKNATFLTRAAMQLLALTFVRTGELIGAQWTEIDFDRAEWNIPAERMKMGRPHVVPLSRQALNILKELHAQTGTKEHIFHAQRGSLKHISNGAVLVALRRMGYHGRMTGHGFRALASTILNEQGYKPDVIERQLAHESDDKIRSAYNRAEYLLERKKMMQDYADYLDSVLVDAEKKVVKGNFSKSGEARK